MPRVTPTKYMTPLFIEILLHYHTTPGDYGSVHNNFDALAVTETFQWFLDNGLLTTERPNEFVREQRYYITPKGHFYVEHGLCCVPLPEATFAIHWE
jgi:hypothetical protein